MTTRMLLWSPLDDYLADLLSTLDGIDFARVTSEADLARLLPAADAMVMLGHLFTAPIARLVREAAPRLRWLQLTTAGYDGISFHGVPDHVAVTNAGRSHAPMVAEHAVTLLSALTRRLHLFAEPQARGAWDRAIALPLVTLEDATVVVLGYGGIGREIAIRLKAFGARVIAVARTARADDIADRVVGSGDFRAALAGADALVIAAALTAETKGMVDAAALAAMKPGGALVNIARGGIVDQPALLAALRSGHLGCAGLDVTDPEPPPPGDPIWTTPGLIITPHVSGLGSTGVRRRIADLVRENTRRFQRGEALAWRVA